MTTIYNIYCDESCHLENDNKKVMVLGAVWSPLKDTHIISEQIRKIKKKHGLSKKFEIKWTKVSPAKINFYLDIVNYFFENKNLSFRAVLIPDKSKLRHKDFQQKHDDWYYKMYFTLLKMILDPSCKYRIYLDIKDSHTHTKTEKLHGVLCNNIHDFNGNIIERSQPIRSEEVEQIQLTDLFIGALSYINRNLNSSQAKLSLIKHIQKQSHFSLIKSTAKNEPKFNIFIWQAKEDDQ